MAGPVAEAVPQQYQHQSGMASPRLVRSRTHSLSSDRPSTIGQHSLLSPPQSVSPEAAFIAASAASQIVTNDHDSHADTWYDQHGIEPAGETALVSQGALDLVNNFLDQLLFNFLHVSKATTLVALRPAVSEVLKPKLAKDAIRNADEELREYLGGADEDDYIQPNGANNSRDWDGELVWKRTRLRCMVYSSLGDMEEEDEDLYMEQENLEIGADEQISDVISPAVAIFLTSVMEYMGELTLTVAGQAAYHRMRVKFEKDLKEGIRDAADIADRIVVEDVDMERVALDRTLGRLWRGWKKRIRAPAIDLVSRPSFRGASGHLRHDSNVSDVATPRALSAESASELHTSKAIIAEDVHPADIPLPAGDRDVDEIEVPGLAVHSDDEDDEEEDTGFAQRPRSLYIPAAIAEYFHFPAVLQGDKPAPTKHKRSISTPGSRAVPYGKWPMEVPPAVDAEIVEAQEEQEDQDLEGPELEEPEPVAEVIPESEADDDEDDFKTPDLEPSSGLERAVPAVPKTKKRPSQIITSRKPRELEIAADDVGFEEAEIMTSSRVSVTGSVSGSVSPPHSDSGKAPQRSSSVRSARLIDVPARTASNSRPPSMDAHDRARPPSLSGVSRTSTPTNAEEQPKSRVSEAVSRGPVAVPVSRSPMERVRPVLQNAATISESEEEADGAAPVDEGVAGVPAPVGSASVPAPIAKDAPAQAPRGTSLRTSSMQKHEQPPTNKFTTIGPGNSSGPFIEESIPEIPYKSPNRGPVKADAVGVVTVERTRTWESEDAAPGPAQSSTSPRQIHTSGSSGSSAAGRRKAVRTSEEQTTNRAEHVARNFEELIQSNQTITYTLTPESMRDPNAIDSPVLPRFPRKSEDARAQQTRSRSSSSATEVKSAPTVNRATAMSSHPVPDIVTTVTRGPSVPKSPRLPGSMAREARVPAKSTADFAEFIKSTGPAGENRPLPLRNVQVQAPVVQAAVVQPKSSMESRRASTTSTRAARYQPREAVVDNKADNSDLIDFIRQGPPSSAVANHRIPRHVAPFRNTMDSDQMVISSGGRAVDATIPEIRYSQASTNMTETSMPSMQSSVNSSSALLKNKGGAVGMPKMFDEDDMMPKRKTRRVKDPYAIDFSDEEDEEEFVPAPKPPIKREESLAEFLQNYQPPPEPRSAAITPQKPKKKASAPSLMARFTRSQSYRDAQLIKSSYVPRSPPPPRQADTQSLSSRTSGKGYIPIQVNVPAGYDQYGPLDGGPTGRPRMQSSVSATGRVPMKKFEPRDAVSSSAARTTELAAFLRDSGPPPSTSGVSNGTASLRGTGEDAGGFSKMLGRRRKVAV